MTKTKSTVKIVKRQDSRKAYCLSNPLVRMQHRKGRSPRQVMPTSRTSNSGICKNSASGAIQLVDDKFCSRCSCYICHSFNDNKDPSLWLVCKSSSSQKDSCGLACHIECALQHERVGVVSHGQIMQLDGSYYCACGKVIEILGCWRKQLRVAQDARQVDALQYRVNLSYRLLDGTSRFKELHEIVQNAKSTLEASIDIENEMRQGMVTRRTIASEVQKLCSLAIEKADEWLATVPNVDLVPREVLLPATFKCVFEEITHSSVTILVIEMSNVSSEGIKGYKLSYYKSMEESPQNGPFRFSRAHRKIVISELQPCTEYTFQITPFTSTGDRACCEVKRFTESVDIFQKRRHSLSTLNYAKEGHETNGSSHGSKMNHDPLMIDSGLKVQNFGTILPLALAEEQGPIEEFHDTDTDNFQGGSKMIEVETPKEDHLLVVSHGLDLNASMPDLNEDVTHTQEPSKNDDNDCALQSAVEVDHVEKIGLARQEGIGDSRTSLNGPIREKSIVNSCVDVCVKRVESTNEMRDNDITSKNGSLFLIPNDSCSSEESLDYCMKIFRWLEREGHITEEFRLKLVIWFCLRSTEQERVAVNTYIQTVIDNPCALVGQLVDSFGEIIARKRPRN